MNQKKNTVLIIEDEPAIRKLLTITLEGSGYRAWVLSGSIIGSTP